MTLQCITIDTCVCVCVCVCLVRVCPCNCIQVQIQTYLIWISIQKNIHTGLYKYTCWSVWVYLVCMCLCACVCVFGWESTSYIHTCSLSALLSSSWFSVLLKASGQQACYTFHPVSQNVSMEDCSDPSVCFCAGRAVLTGCGILGTIGSKWTQLADFRCRLVTLDIACRKDWTVVCMPVRDSSSFSFHGTPLSETLLRDMSTTNTITLQTFKPV